MAKMRSNKELLEKFDQMLTDKKEAMRRCVNDRKLAYAKVIAYKIEGIAYAMYNLELITLEDMDYIAENAKAAAEGKEPEYEAC